MPSTPPGSSDSRRVLLLVGTQKGLFRLVSDPTRKRWSMTGPLIAGYEILHAWLDPRRPGTAFAAASHMVWGAHIYRSDDYGRSWYSLNAVPHHHGARDGETLRNIWCLAPGPATEPDTLYAGIDPAGVFVSRDAGGSWEPVQGLNQHPTRGTWEPAKGGFSAHSICWHPATPERLYAAISAGGAYRSDDRGETWYPINAGVRAENLPSRYAVSGHNIHRLLVHPADPDRLYRQCYSGVYRSDDGGLHWTEITEGLPSDFGYALATRVDAPDSLYVIPIDSNHMRTTPHGRLRVYRSDDGGRYWRALTSGLPQEHAYVTVLREAMDTDMLDPTGVYFGTSSGHVFASADGGESWHCVAEFLPRVLSVQAALVDNHD